MNKIKKLQKKSAKYCKTFQSFQQIGEPITKIEYTPPFSYGLQYPKTGHTNIDKRIVKIVDKIRTDFDKKYSPSKLFFLHNSSSSEATLLLSYESYSFSVSHFSLIFFETHELNNVFSTPQIYAYHFDLRQDQEQSPKDLMFKNFRQAASHYAQAFFQRSLCKKDLFSNYTHIISAESGLFDRFALTHDGILFYIEPNIILPNSYGLIRLVISYEDIQQKVQVIHHTKQKVFQTKEFMKPMVALTFDDGPNPIYTNIILDVLEKYNTTATFFDLGNLVERFPSVAQRELALNCEVASHSYSHDNLLNLSDQEIVKDVEHTAKIFQRVLGQEPALFRPPGGHYDRRIESLIPLPLILWSLDTRDWESRNANAIIKTIKSAGNLDGKVLLMHSIYESSAKAATMLIPYLLEEGYQLVTISQLIKLGHGDIPRKGKTYNFSYFQ